MDGDHAIAYALLINWLVAALAMLLAFCRICRRLGFPGWLGVLSIVPLLNLAFFLYLAFARWPAADAPRKAER